MVTVDLNVIHQHAEGGGLVKHLGRLSEEWINQELQIVLERDGLIINLLFHALLIQEFLANLYSIKGKSHTSLFNVRIGNINVGSYRMGPVCGTGFGEGRGPSIILSIRYNLLQVSLTLSTLALLN